MHSSFFVDGNAKDSGCKYLRTHLTKGGSTEFNLTSRPSMVNLSEKYASFADCRIVVIQSGISTTGSFLDEGFIVQSAPIILRQSFLSDPSLSETVGSPKLFRSTSVFSKIHLSAFFAAGLVVSAEQSYTDGGRSCEGFSDADHPRTDELSRASASGKRQGRKSRGRAAVMLATVYGDLMSTVFVGRVACRESDV